LRQVVQRLRLEPAPKKRGRPFVYTWPTVLGCFMVLVTYRLTGFRSLHRFLKGNPSLAQACGLPEGQVPCDRTFSRRFQRLDGVLLQATAQLLRRLTSRRLLRWTLTVIDATPLVAKGRRPKGKTAERRTTDKEARWGRSTTKGWFWGYKLHVLVAVRPVILPLAWTVTPAHRNDVTQLLPVVAQARLFLRRLLQRIREVVGDMAYDCQARYRTLASWRIRLTTPINRRRGGRPSPLQRKRRHHARSHRGRRLLKRRADVERFFSQDKGIFQIDPLPVVGQAQVTTYISVVLVTYLAGVAYNGWAHRPPRALKSLVA